MKKVFVAALAASMALTFYGCGSANNNTQSAQEEPSAAESSAGEDASSADDSEASADASVEVTEGLYFQKGVYANYIEGEEAAQAAGDSVTKPSKHYYYVFDSATEGATQDGDHAGIGLPFRVAQEDGAASFTFAAEDEPPEVFTVTSSEGGVIKGYFENAKDMPLVFERIEDADPDTFDGEAYMFSLGENDRSSFRDAMGTFKQATLSDGCSSFEDVIANAKSGQGYAVVTVDGTEVLLISPADSTFEKNASAAEVFAKTEYESVDYVGYITSGDSANPLAVGGDRIWAVSHHYTAAITVNNGSLVFEEEAWEENDPAGNTANYYKSNEYMTAIEGDEARELSEALWSAYGSAKAIEFEIVK